MSDLISKAVSNFQEKITEYYLPIINPSSHEFRQHNNKVLLNKTIKSKSQHAIQKIIATSSNQSPPNTGTTYQYSFGQSNPPKDNESIQFSIQMNKTINQKEISNDMISINQLIQEKKKELIADNKYFLKEISRIRQDFQLKAKIRNKLQKDRKSTTSSQDKYEICWDETLKEMNKDSQEQDQLVDSISKINQEQIKKTQRPKPLRSQIFSKIREQENQYFKQYSESLIKQMKQRSIQVVDEVSAQIEQIQLLKKEQQNQRSKEREDAKKEIIKSLRCQEQKKILSLLKNKSSNYYLQPQRKNIEQSDDATTNSFSKSNKRRSTSFNKALPFIDFKQDKGIIQNIVEQQNQTKLQFLEKTQFKRKNIITKSINSQPFLDLSKVIKCS
ncbi:unnamed protein product [Paramecium sonneborni]|uniref:Uncharacterized protein n=1 Tax=Paramecium sonneborni TaxID=65129 RepID=A0A8S1KLL6_9CILI|nr:unnamed protein product [Paramecium sonneborni]